MSNDPWWQGAVFYQIYPRSFCDSNADGVGDLRGATEKLDHISACGFDAIWLSPFYASPMADFGYDVTDYCAVDPLFGTLDDFDAFLKRAHALGLKVIIDMVLAHTSKDHEWFKQSRTSRDNPKSDWYVWADPKPDGTPPNNWMSIFGGVAWTFDTRRAQFYLHHFLKEQPQLNFHNPDVQAEIFNICRFWLNRGVDGFRLDVINFLFHDTALRNNPPKDPEKEGWSSQFTKPDPYSMQHHVYDKSRPEGLLFAEKFRQMMNEYPGTMTLAEIGDDYFIQCAADYTQGQTRYHTAYNFALMTGDEVMASMIRTAVETYEQSGGGWPSWSFCNHDVVRVVTRWGQKKGYDRQPAFAKMLMALLCSLKGTIFMYQGEELGLTEATLTYDQLQDPWGKYLWPEWQGRDGCRTPLPWDDTQTHAGFSLTSGSTWLPVAPEHTVMSVRRQKDDPQSVYHFLKTFLAWRRTQPALIRGDIRFIDTGDEELLMFERGQGDERRICLFNLSDQMKTYPKLSSMGLMFGASGETLPAFGYQFWG